MYYKLTNISGKSKIYHGSSRRRVKVGRVIRTLRDGQSVVLTEEDLLKYRFPNEITYDSNPNTWTKIHVLLAESMLPVKEKDSNSLQTPEGEALTTEEIQTDIEEPIEQEDLPQDEDTITTDGPPDIDSPEATGDSIEVVTHIAEGTDGNIGTDEKTEITEEIKETEEPEITEEIKETEETENIDATEKTEEPNKPEEIEETEVVEETEETEKTEEIEETEVTEKTEEIEVAEITEGTEVNENPEEVKEESTSPVITEEGNDTESQEKPEGDDGVKEDPYTVEQLIKMGKGGIHKIKLANGMKLPGYNSMTNTQKAEAVIKWFEENQ